jgi:hypothetical protein
LPTGNTITISVYEWLFVITDDQVPLFFQSCIADNLGEYIDNPFSARAPMGQLEVEDADSSIEDSPEPFEE